MNILLFEVAYRLGPRIQIGGFASRTDNLLPRFTFLHEPWILPSLESGFFLLWTRNYRGLFPSGPRIQNFSLRGSNLPKMGKQYFRKKYIPGMMIGRLHRIYDLKHWGSLTCKPKMGRVSSHSGSVPLGSQANPNQYRWIAFLTRMALRLFACFNRKLRDRGHL